MLKQSETLNILPIAQASLFVYRASRSPHDLTRHPPCLAATCDTYFPCWRNRGGGEGRRRRRTLQKRGVPARSETRANQFKTAQGSLSPLPPPSLPPSRRAQPGASVGLILQRKQLTGDSSPSSSLLRERGRSACQGFSAVGGATLSRPSSPPPPPLAGYYPAENYVSIDLNA